MRLKHLPILALLALPSWGLAQEGDDNSAIRDLIVDLGARQEASQGWTPLHAAAQFSDNPAVITALVAAGAEVDAREDDGDTPLHLAARYNYNSAVTLALLGAGADVTARNSASVADG